MARAIINSDDFGYSPEVNKAIVMAFEKGYISSTTMLTNFDEGFAGGREIINSGVIHPEAIGIHLNLTEGKPLTEPIKAIGRFCDGGIFHGRARQTKIFTLAPAERKAAHDELNEQLEKFKTLGFSPSHIDSHHHIHTELGIMNIVAKLARSHNVKNIRLSRNAGNGIGKAKRLYKYLFNKYISVLGLKSTELMGDIDDYVYNGIPANAAIEIMVHAIFIKEGLCDLDGKDMRTKLDLLPLSGVQLINYTQL